MSTCSSHTQHDYPSDCQVTEGLRTMAQQRAQLCLDSPALKPVLAKAQAIRLVLLDVDGVLTDGTLLYSEDGGETKCFNTQDGFGLRLLQEAGIDVGVITARQSDIVARRAKELKMRYIYQGAPNKLVAYKEITSQSGLRPIEICYMGDDWLDLVLLNRVGLAVAPANGVAEVREKAHYTTSAAGGHGAVRELCDLLLRAQGKHDELLQKYMSR